jgi:NADH:ubiquinone oxidoreductase subunit K
MILVHFQILSACLFSLGLYGVLARRSAILILMAVELMLNAVNVNLVATASFRSVDNVTGQIIAIFVVTIAAAEIALALAIVLRLFRARGSANVDELDQLHG